MLHTPPRSLKQVASSLSSSPMIDVSPVPHTSKVDEREEEDPSLSSTSSPLKQSSPPTSPAAAVRDPSSAAPEMSVIGRVVHARTYARRVGTRLETWDETCRRVVQSANTQLHVGLSAAEQEEFFGLLRDLRCSVAGRFLWQLGTGVVDKYGLLSLQNCAFTTISGESPQPYRAFQWIFDCLMLGVGVGVRISQEDVYSLPRVRRVDGFKRKDSKDADYIVPDTREGWVALLGKLLKAHFYTGRGFTYSCQLIRSAGEPISTFGGTASGPRMLHEGLQRINEVINRRVGPASSHSEGAKLRPVDVLDIVTLIGMIVVSGNVRRSALIMLGDATDDEYLHAKDWGRGSIPNWRAYSNNSVLCDDFCKIPEEFWEGYRGNGEPYGLVNMPLMRSCGRTGDLQYPDPRAKGCNPCAEQTLEDNETCCLGEIFLPNVTSEAQLRTCAAYLYRLNKHSLALRCHWPTTEQVVHRNMRMGISVSGVAQCTEEQLSWLRPTYTYLRDLDAEYSARHSFPRSIKLTTVKPSGTLSLLGGTTAGIHPAYAQFYIRRVRFAASDPLLPALQRAGYHTEFARAFDGSEDTATVIVQFPMRTPAGTLLAEETTAVKQLELVKRLQSDWSDNSVSVTVTYRKDELPAIREWLAQNYNTHIKSVSFLLHHGHGFVQAPLEPISEEAYLTAMAKLGPVTELFPASADDDQAPPDLECAGGVCPVR